MSLIIVGANDDAARRTFRGRSTTSQQRSPVERAEIAQVGRSEEGEFTMPNLVSMVSQFLTPDMVARIASAFGFDRRTLQKAIDGAIPSLLAAFSSIAGQPGGPQKLADAATQQIDTLNSFPAIIGSGRQSSFSQQGLQMLGSLLGSGGQIALTGAISKFVGIGQGASGSLLGMLAPVVMGMIAKQQGTAENIDPGKIASLLSDQKDNIAAALPSGLGSLLAGTGVLDSLGGAARGATARTGDWASASARAATDAGRSVVGTTASASPNWLYWLVPAAAVVALVAYFASGPAEQIAQQPTPTEQATTTNPQRAAVNPTDVGREVTDDLNNLHNTLGGITDVASAQAALPKLQETAAKIDRANGLSAQLSPDQRKSVAGLVSAVMPALEQLFNKVLAIPGVPDELKPTVEALKEKLATLTA
jgi:hypothetical protein